MHGLTSLYTNLKNIKAKIKRNHRSIIFAENGSILSLGTLTRFSYWNINMIFASKTPHPSICLHFTAIKMKDTMLVKIYVMGA